MADITITVGNVLIVSGQPTKQVANVSLTAGQTVYLDSVSGQLKLAHAVTSLATATCVGITTHASLAGQPQSVAGPGLVLAFGAILTAGVLYVVSGANAGGIAPVSDQVATWFTGVLGFALTTSNLQLMVFNTGVAHG